MKTIDDFITYNVKVVESGKFTEVYYYMLEQSKLIDAKNHEKEDFDMIIDNIKKEKVEKQESARSDESVRRIKRNMRRLINANDNQYKERDKFVTLTFKEEPPNREYVANEFRKFIRRLKRSIKRTDFEYIAVIEKSHKNTERLHLHVIFYNLPYLKITDLVKIWKVGIAYIEAINQIENEFKTVAEYMLKYVTKTLTEDSFIKKHQKFYITSMGLKRPVEKYMDSCELEEYLEDKGRTIIDQEIQDMPFVGTIRYMKLQKGYIKY